MDAAIVPNKLKFSDFYKDFKLVNIEEKTYNGEKDNYLNLFETIDFKDVLSVIQEKGLNDYLFLYRFGTYAYDYIINFENEIVHKAVLDMLNSGSEKINLDYNKIEINDYIIIAKSIAVCYLSRFLVFEPQNRINEYDGLCAGKLGCLFGYTQHLYEKDFYDVYTSIYPQFDNVNQAISGSWSLITSFLFYKYLMWRRTDFYRFHFREFSEKERECLEERENDSGLLYSNISCLSEEERNTFYLDRWLLYSRKLYEIEEKKLVNIINSK